MRPQSLKLAFCKALQYQSFLATNLPDQLRAISYQTTPATMASLSDTELISQINTFWFTGPDLLKRWFGASATLDAEMRHHFLLPIIRARSSALDDWPYSASGSLALLLLLDQFPRNIYRGSPSAYSSDRKALDVAVSAIARGQDREAELLEQPFFYLPLMHDESLLGQVAALGLYEGLIARCPEGTTERDFAEKGLESTRKHLVVIERFGRFPSRNGVLGRESTREETKYLEEHPDGF